MIVEHIRVSSVGGEHFGVFKSLQYFSLSPHSDTVAAWACNISQETRGQWPFRPAATGAHLHKINSQIIRNSLFLMLDNFIFYQWGFICKKTISWKLTNNRYHKISNLSYWTTLYYISEAIFASSGETSPEKGLVDKCWERTLHSVNRGNRGNKNWID